MGFHDIEQGLIARRIQSAQQLNEEQRQHLETGNMEAAKAVLPEIQRNIDEVAGLPRAFSIFYTSLKEQGIAEPTVEELRDIVVPKSGGEQQPAALSRWRRRRGLRRKSLADRSSNPVVPDSPLSKAPQDKQTFRFQLQRKPEIPLVSSLYDFRETRASGAKPKDKPELRPYMLRDLGPREDDLGMATFEIRDDQTGFINGTWNEMFTKVYGENPNKAQEATTRFNAKHKVRPSFVNKFSSALAAPLESLPKHIQSFITWVREQPLYARASTEELLRVAERTDQNSRDLFAELTQKYSPPQTRTTSPDNLLVAPVSLSPEVPSVPSMQPEQGEEEIIPPVKLSPADLLMLANRLETLDPKALGALGIMLYEKDRHELARIQEDLVERVGEEMADIESARARLQTHQSNPEEGLLAHEDDRDAQLLLTYVAPLTSTRRIAELFPTEDND